jgi:hypothetical protein
MNVVMKKQNLLKVYGLDLSPQLAAMIDVGISRCHHRYCTREAFVHDCILYGLYSISQDFDDLGLVAD